MRWWFFEIASIFKKLGLRNSSLPLEGIENRTPGFLLCASTVNNRVTSSGCRCTLLLSNTVVGQLQGFILSFNQRTDNNRAAVLCPIRREKWKCDVRKDRKRTRSHDKACSQNIERMQEICPRKHRRVSRKLHKLAIRNPQNSRRSNIIRNYQNGVYFRIMNKHENIFFIKIE